MIGDRDGQINKRDMDMLGVRDISVWCRRRGCFSVNTMQKFKDA